MTHLLRHPLSLVLVVLLALFAIFFVVLPALSLIIHVVIAVAIIWTVLSLFRYQQHHRRQARAPRKS
ncbi:MAG: hypothetical protein M0T72_09460 [Candidatus Dormibacteraeota bacterium]|nr:hypothetical protein [Candidatus Dormibacteraeota bacterium]